MPFVVMYRPPVCDMLEFYPPMESAFIQTLKLEYSVDVYYLCKPSGVRKGVVAMKGSNMTLLQEAFKKLLYHFRITCPSVAVLIILIIFKLFIRESFFFIW